MKRNDKNLDKNISRLVKLTGDKDKPSDPFTSSLIEDALAELNSKASPRPREGRIIKMKAILRIFAAAAVFIVAVGIGYRFLDNPTRLTTRLGRSTSTSVTDKKTDQNLGKDYKQSQPSSIEYTQKGAKVKVASNLSSLGYAQETTDRAIKVESERIPPIATHADFSKANDKIRGFRADGVAGNVGMPSQMLLKERMPYHAPGQPMAHGGTTPPNGENVDAMFFKNYGVNPFVDTEDDHFSTFATDVDTGSYTVVRSFLHDGNLPPNDAVRVEEFVNYFNYDYAAPQNDDFAIYTEAVPWQFGTARKNSHLMRIGLKAKQVSDENRKPAILTFVIDISGSMKRENRLGLVKRSLRLLVDNLKPQDMIGIAVYGNHGRIVMPHKNMTEKAAIILAIESLAPGGSTNAEEGIRIGYDMADSAFKQGCINRVILCSDGVANVGRTGADDIFKVIKTKADKGVTLSAIGFGMGNYNDVMLEQLGDKGNGYYSYIDTFAQAQKLFGKDLTGTLQVVARDVKIQVDFNPDVVRSYRLIGYENRDVADNKFRDDKQDGGEIGAGHSVTALYELKLWPGKSGTAATTFVRYKDAEGANVTEFKNSIDTKNFKKDFSNVSSNFALASTVTEFAEILRHSYWAKDANLDDVLKKAQDLADRFKNDPDVIELIDLIAKSNRLMKNKQLKISDEPAPPDLNTLDE
jgi:Ca-activated chloride channel homolog